MEDEDTRLQWDAAFKRERRRIALFTVVAVIAAAALVGLTAILSVWAYQGCSLSPTGSSQGCCAAGLTACQPPNGQPLRCCDLYEGAVCSTPEVPCQAPRDPASTRDAMAIVLAMAVIVYLVFCVSWPLLVYTRQQRIHPLFVRIASTVDAPAAGTRLVDLTDDVVINAAKDIVGILPSQVLLAVDRTTKDPLHAPLRVVLPVLLWTWLSPQGLTFLEAWTESGKRLGKRTSARMLFLSAALNRSDLLRYMVNARMLDGDLNLLNNECELYFAGLLGFEFLPLLAEVLQWTNHILVQPLLRSSYHQYGFRSVRTDVEDLQNCLDELTTLWGQPSQLVLIAHAAACQAVVHFLKTARSAHLVDRVVFQAPISQRDLLSADRVMQEAFLLAKKDVAAGFGHHFLPRTQPDSIPLTAERCVSFGERLSPDDMFSHDLTDTELQSIFAHVTVPTLWCFSLEDEYVLLDDAEYARLSSRIVGSLPLVQKRTPVLHATDIDPLLRTASEDTLDAMNEMEHPLNGHLLLRLTGNHQLTNNREVQQLFVEAVAAFLSSA